MLDFKTFLYKNIGSRIKNYRKKLGVTQEQLSTNIKMNNYIAMNESNLSAIENGKAHIIKNPYLLTPPQLAVLSERMGCEPNELLFGDETEREENVKLFLLAIIMNSTMTTKQEVEGYVIPFMDFILKSNNSREIIINFNYYLGDNVKEKEKILESSLGYDAETAEKVGVRLIKDWFIKEYPFFTSEVNVEKYKNLVGEPNTEIGFISNLLIKSLLGNIGFAEFLIVKLRKELLANGSNLDLISFNKGMGSYKFFIMNKDYFHLFVHAFNDMWDRNRRLFIEYFEKHLFNLNSPLSDYRKLNNELFHEIITSSDLSNIILSVIENERFTFETMDGHYLFYRSMHEMIIQEKLFIPNE